MTVWARECKLFRIRIIGDLQDYDDALHCLWILGQVQQYNMVNK